MARLLFVSGHVGMSGGRQAAGLDVYEVTDPNSPTGLKKKASIVTAGDQAVGGHFFVSPDGEYLVFHTGVVVATNDIGGSNGEAVAGAAGAGGASCTGLPRWRRSTGATHARRSAVCRTCRSRCGWGTGADYSRCWWRCSRAGPTSGWAAATTSGPASRWWWSSARRSDRPSGRYSAAANSRNGWRRCPSRSAADHSRDGWWCSPAAGQPGWRHRCSRRVNPALHRRPISD